MSQESNNDLTSYRIAGLSGEDQELIQQAAELLVAGFRQVAPAAWPTIESALDEVGEMLAPDRLLRAALRPDGRLLGWVGGIPQYDGHVWELHPLVVDPAYQNRGIGRALVRDFEAQVARRGAETILLGTDDITGLTTLSGIDLYPDPWVHIRHIRNMGGHPFGFYQKLGYVIVGVVPDANGPGKPDILMALRVPQG